jgi:anaerobic ribonucleoside-triphosphate reductase
MYKKEEIENGGIPQGAKCYDCDKELKKGKKHAIYFVKDEELLAIFKCQECYEKDNILHYKKQDCDVYSRIVGYYSNLKQWNKGKVEEWSDRKTFKFDNNKK